MKSFLNSIREADDAYKLRELENIADKLREAILHRRLAIAWAELGDDPLYAKWAAEERLRTDKVLNQLDEWYKKWQQIYSK